MKNRLLDRKLDKLLPIPINRPITILITTENEYELSITFDIVNLDSTTNDCRKNLL